MILAGRREPTCKITDNGYGMKEVEWEGEIVMKLFKLTRLNDRFDSRQVCQCLFTAKMGKAHIRT